MGKAIFGVLVLTVMFAASCKKGTPAGGSWVFRGDTNYVTTCIPMGNAIGASSSTNGNVNTFGELSFFPGPALPTASGTYTVVDTTPVGNQVSIAVTIGGATDTAYNATGGNGSNQTIVVTVANGKTTLSGTGIEMLNSLVPTDSSGLSFDVFTAGN